MLQHVIFQNSTYKMIITDHARQRMQGREITKKELIEVIEKGEIKPKKQKNRYWVFKYFENRLDNLICASISIEKPNLIVITTLVNWRPTDANKIR